MSTKPVRVCLDCYEKLSHEKSKNAGSVTDGNNTAANNKLNQQLSSSGEDSEEDDPNKSGTNQHDEAKFYGDAEKINEDK